MSGTPIYTRDQARAMGILPPKVGPMAKPAPAPKKRRPSSPSKIEADLASQIVLAGLPEPRRECIFDTKRQWRMDFSWPAQKVSVECEGGLRVQGRHQRAEGFQEDCCKQNEAEIAGWLYLRVTAEHVATGQAIDWIRRALAVRSER